MVVAAIWIVWTFVLFLVTPRDLAWHVRNALDRLLLHPAALALVAFLSLTKNSNAAKAGM